jgi:4-diphosphocytidyl-2-C-methyl-D-erythritol kinase
MKSISRAAPAKINLRLDVLARRADGYHDVRMIMQQLDLSDDVTITRVASPGITVSCGSDGVPEGPDNIAWRAARLLLDRFGRDDGLHITIAKRIPVAAGLGGGSSDGAAVLLGINDLLGLGASREELMALGVMIGADVPFFIYAPVAVAEGIGEILSPVAHMPEFWVVLVNPRLAVSTAWVYQNLRLTSDKNRDIFPRSFEDVPAVCAALANDLESVTIPAYPVVGEIKARLLQLGAAGAMMSGSGPTVFGIFTSQLAAQAAAAALVAEVGWFVAVARSQSGR